MNGNKCKDAELLQDIYSNVKMGSESIINLLPRVDSDELKSCMTAQLNQYEKYAENVRGKLTAQGIVPREASAISRLGARIGMEMKSMQDSTTSHLAQMMVQGSTMDVTDLLQRVSTCEGYPECAESVSLAREIVAFEERNIERMKEFL